MPTSSRHSRRPARVVGSLVATAALLAGCSSGDADDGASTEASGNDAVHLTLQWVVQAQFAGFYAGLEQGYYADEGIDLTIQPGGSDVNNLQLLVSGDTDIAVQSYGNLAAAVDSGADLVGIGVLHERPGATLIYFTDQGDLSDPASWEGLTVGNWNGFSAPFSAAAAKNGLDVDTDLTIANQGFDMSGFLSGEYDLAEAMTYNEYAQAIAGADGREISTVDYAELGTAVLEDTLVTTPAWLEDNPDLAERFLRATAKGWLYCRDNPEECVSIVLENGTALPENYQTWQMNEINKLMWPSDSGVLGVSEDLVEQSNTILEDYDIVSQPVADDLLDLTARDAAVADLTDEELYGDDYTSMDLDPEELFAE
ncbi:MAG TPA: ABC transporter substrate-binding protein [Cellulomonas sp.]